MEIRIPKTPTPVAIDGRSYLFYELLLTNFSTHPLYLHKLDVRTKEDKIMITRLGPEELSGRASERKSIATPSKSVLLEPGQWLVLYMELPLSGNKVGLELEHLLYGGLRPDPAEEESCLCHATLLLPSQAPVILGPPLSGGPWAAVYDPLWTRGHRRVVYTSEDTIHIPGRLAIDFVQLDSKGHFARGNSDSVKNWLGYDAEVRAVADGVVSSVRSDFGEAGTLSSHPDYPAQLATGNYISLKIGAHRYAFYEHLKPGSIVVQGGQQVKKGELLARVGFTGQSTGPHLHFHLADADSPLSADGLPFVFDSFTRLGAYTDFTLFGKGLWKANSQGRTQRRTKEMPSSNSVIFFRL